MQPADRSGAIITQAVKPRRRSLLAVALLGIAWGCGNDAMSPSPSVSTAATCLSTSSPIQLGPGAHVVVDPASTGGCLSIPGAGASGAEYLVVALSTTGQVPESGVTAPYQLSAQSGSLTASIAAPGPASRLTTAPSPAAKFHAMLRVRERELSRVSRLPASTTRLPSLAATTVSLGSQRNFQVCGDVDCRTFVTVTGTVKHVGPHGLIYLDNAAPPNGYTQSDLDRMGSLFDAFLYPIDTTAFGRETDLDGNGAVVILLSPAVNKISGNCNQTHSVVEGFFFPDDLIPGSAGSNSARSSTPWYPSPPVPSARLHAPSRCERWARPFCTSFSI